MPNITKNSLKFWLSGSIAEFTKISTQKSCFLVSATEWWKKITGQKSIIFILWKEPRIRWIFLGFFSSLNTGFRAIKRNVRKGIGRNELRRLSVSSPSPHFFNNIKNCPLKNLLPFFFGIYFPHSRYSFVVVVSYLFFVVPVFELKTKSFIFYLFLFRLLFWSINKLENTKKTSPVIYSRHWINFTPRRSFERWEFFEGFYSCTVDR